MSLTPGQQFGRYKIQKTLGAGGMGSVFLAHDPKLDRRVALKTILEGGAAGEETIGRFYREARAAANFRHSNLCKVYDVDEIDGTHYLTMEYIEGRRLSDFLGMERPLINVATTLAITHGVALGLAEAHRLGVIHRDLKPANIMIDPAGTPVIVDFGLARREMENEPALTENGVFMGTRSYASPEQWTGDPSRVGPATDIYSLGVVLYQMLAGRLPFVGPTLDSLMFQVLMGVPDPPSASRPGLDPSLDEICLRAIARAPADRFGSMAEFARSLESVLSTFRKDGGRLIPSTLVDPNAPTVEWAGTKPAQPRSDVPDARPTPGELTKTVKEASGVLAMPLKPLTDDFNSFAGDSRDRQGGHARTMIVATIVACLAGLLIGAWLIRNMRQTRESVETPATVATVETPATVASVEKPSTALRNEGASNRVTTPGLTVVAENAPTKPVATKTRPVGMKVPGHATIVTRKGDILDVVRQDATKDSPSAEPVRAGQRVELVERSADGRKIKIRDVEGNDLGWITEDYLVPVPLR